MTENEDCLFCKIVNKQIPCSIVFEDKEILAFRDINPQAPVHILIITKKHIPGLNEIGESDNQVLGHIQNTARELAKKEGLSKDGYRLVLNCGPNAGQAVGHIHYHLLGGRKFAWPPG
jgi:histidine triad (HIT) family protein